MPESCLVGWIEVLFRPKLRLEFLQLLNIWVFFVMGGYGYGCVRVDGPFRRFLLGLMKVMQIKTAFI